MTVTLNAEVLEQYRRFSLYNSPYPAHDHGHAIDLYPDSNTGISPIDGEVLDTHTVRCPDRPYAGEHDHLILVDTGEYVARILHVEPAVEPGDHVAVGDPLGEMIRSGFFGQWVDNHVHLGFRQPTQNPHRASGSIRIAVDVSVEGLTWDGTGTVVETGPTHAVLDTPTHPAPGERFVALAADDGTPLDGGLVHYSGGGALAPTTGPISLLGQEIGVVDERGDDGRTIAWNDVAIVANGTRVTGLSLFAAQDPDFGVKLVCPDHDFAVRDEIAVTIEPTAQPIQLD